MQKCALKGLAGLGIITFAGWLLALPGVAQQLANRQLALTAHAPDGSYELSTRGGAAHTVLRAGVAARIDGQWVHSKDYPQHQAAESAFSDALGSGRQVAITCSGLEGKPDMIYTLQVYDQRPYGAVQVELANHGSGPVAVESLRSVEAVGSSAIDLGGPAAAGRILSDSFSEDWPELVIYDFGKAPGGMHRGAGSQLIYNRQSRQSLFFGAVSADRWLTLIHLSSTGRGEVVGVGSFTVDSTGTTEIKKEVALRGAPAAAQVELSLPLPPGGTMASERVMVAAGSDYRGQLTAYGEAIRQLHQARVSARQLSLGGGAGPASTCRSTRAALTNAEWQAQHLKSLGYRFFHIDEGYQYARGEYTTPNATPFPARNAITRRPGSRHGSHLRPLDRARSRSALALPFTQHHKDWLVHTADGKPITIGRVADGDEHSTRWIPLIRTPRSICARPIARSRTTGAFAISSSISWTPPPSKDTTTSPNTTALEAQRIGLEIIRKAVGDDVLLDKDGSPMLTPVGLVDAGRISADTAPHFR